jgi:uncharacterized membrane protein
LSDETSGAAGEQSIGNLVKDATTHLSTLVRAEVELAKQEVSGEVKKAVKGSVWFILALVIFAYSSFFVFFFLAELLDIWLPRWAAFLIVFGIMWVVVAISALLGYRKFRKIRAPERTIESMKETAATLRHVGEDGHETAPAPATGDAVRRY